jgi:glutamine amidotransferase
MLVIVDYGLGNLGSIKNMLKKIGVESEITGDLDKINAATKLILPGVGAFDNGMQNLNDLKLTEVLNDRVVKNKIPILGICLGMQLMTKSSEEGVLPGLGWVDALTLKFNFQDGEKRLTVPHMGWEIVKQEKQSKLLEGMYSDPRFYFVHSYFVKANDQADVLLTTIYGNEYVSGFEKGNILGVQFHPEKSHKYGMVLLKNFVTHY